VQAAHSPKHELSEAEYLVSLLAVITEMNLDVLPL